MYNKKRNAEKRLNDELNAAMLEEAVGIIRQVAAFERTDQLKGHSIMAACKQFLNPRIFHEKKFGPS